MITVVGEPGIGKTRLAHEFIGTARDRATVFTVRCEPNTDTAYLPLHQLLVQAAARAEAPEHLVRQLDAALGAHDPASDPLIGPTMTRLLAAVAVASPVVLVCDDAHWAQPALLDLIESIATGAGAAVMLLCLARPELKAIRPSFGTGADAMELRQMAPDDIRTLLLDAVPEPSAADELVWAAAGNPLFAMQLIAWTADGTTSARPVPAAVRTLLAHRISALGPGEQAVVRCAAVIGRDFTVAAVQWLMPAHAQSTVGSHCNALTQQRFVQPSDEGYRFRHDLIQRAAYLAIDPGTRVRLHEEYGQWLAGIAPIGDVPAEETIGYHFERAYDNLHVLGTQGDHARRLGVQAAVQLRAAGRRAFRSADLQGAVSLFARALRLLPHDHDERVGLLIDAARPLRASGRVGDAVSILLEAASRAEDLGDTAAQWRARLELAVLRSSDTEDWNVLESTLDVAVRAIEPLTAVRDDEGLAEAWLMIAFHRELAGQLREAVVAYRRASRHTLRTPSSPRDGGVTWGLASLLLEGATPAHKAIVQCRKLLNYRGRVEPGAMFQLAVLLAMTAQFDQARDLLDEAAVDVRGRGAVRPPLFLALARARVELIVGDLESAERHARHGLELGAAKGGDEVDSAHAIILCRVLCQQRRLDEVEEIVAAHANRTSRQDVVRTAWWNAIRARVRAHRQAVPQAIDLAHAATRDIDKTEYLNHRADINLMLVEVYRAAGQAAAARDGIDTAVRLLEAKENVAGLSAARALSEQAHLYVDVKSTTR
jgi:tetratricopeptide (TPR) repeat protein